MAMIWIEGFEELGTTLNSAPSPTGVIARKYQYVGNEANMTIVSGRYAGLALNLLHQQGRLPGAVRLIFQPVQDFQSDFGLVWAV